jgi:hypothetical protein
MNKYQFDREIFSKGYTVPALASFEEKYKISLNIYEIGRNGPEETRVYYNSIYNDDYVFPDVKKINLGILREGENVHFVLIKKIQVLFGKKNEIRHVRICQDCKICFSTTELLLRHYKEDHKNDENEDEKQRIILPKDPDSAWIKFDIEKNQSDFEKTQRKHFVIYAHLESNTHKYQGAKDPKKKTHKIARQTPNSFAAFCPDLMFLTDGKKLHRESYFKTGQDDNPYKVVKGFIDALFTFRNHCLHKYNSHPKIPKLTPEEKERHEHAITCEKCHQEFSKESPKVRHHDHVTGKYIGPWCRLCNFREGMIKFPLVIFVHNLRGYDGHILIRYGLSEIAQKLDIDVTSQFIMGKVLRNYLHFNSVHLSFVILIFILDALLKLP